MLFLCWGFPPIKTSMLPNSWGCYKFCEWCPHSQPSVIHVDYIPYHFLLWCSIVSLPALHSPVESGGCTAFLSASPVRTFIELSETLKCAAWNLVTVCEKIKVACDSIEQTALGIDLSTLFIRTRDVCFLQIDIIM